MGAAPTGGAGASCGRAESDFSYDTRTQVPNAKFEVEVDGALPARSVSGDRFAL